MRRWQTLSGVVSGFLVGVVVGWAILPQPIRHFPAGAPAAPTATSTGSVLLDYGDGRVVTYAEVPLITGQTVWELMRRLESARGLTLEFRDYGGDLGVLVAGIGGVRNDARTNRFWHYWVNQRFAEVGVSQYRLKPADQVMWKYTESQFRAETK